MGGVFVQGSLLLLAGDLGIRKSILVLQTTKNICEIKLKDEKLKRHKIIDKKINIKFSPKNNQEAKFEEPTKILAAK